MNSHMVWILTGTVMSVALSLASRFLGLRMRMGKAGILLLSLLLAYPVFVGPVGHGGVWLNLVGGSLAVLAILYDVSKNK